MRVQPFTLTTEFCDAGSGAASLAELEQEVATLRQQLTEAHARGVAEGREEALALLRGERETALLGAGEALAAGIAGLEARFAEVERAAAAAAAGLALDLADHLAGQALAREPLATVDTMIGRALQQVRRGCPLRIRVPTDLADAVEQLAETRQQRDRRQLFLTVVPDDTLPPGDARIEWDDGALVLDRAARLAAMTAELEGTLAA